MTKRDAKAYAYKLASRVLDGCMGSMDPVLDDEASDTKVFSALEDISQSLFNRGATMEERTNRKQ